MTTIEIEEVINIKSKFRTKEELFEYLLDLIESEELWPILTQIKKEKDFISEEEFLTNY